MAKELGLVEERTLRNWATAAYAGKLTVPNAKFVTPEHMELSRLRAENARQRMECEILKMRRRTSRRMYREVRLDRYAAAGISAADDVGATAKTSRTRGPRIARRLCSGWLALG